jgi:hypothetical protein
MANYTTGIFYHPSFSRRSYLTVGEENLSRRLTMQRATSLKQQKPPKGM